MPVTVAVLPFKDAPLPNACCFSENVTMWAALHQSISKANERIGAARAADCLAGILHQASGMSLSGCDGRLALPQACLETVVSYVQAYTALRPSLAGVTNPKKVRAWWCDMRWFLLCASLILLCAYVVLLTRT